MTNIKGNNSQDSNTDLKLLVDALLRSPNRKTVKDLFTEVVTHEVVGDTKTLSHCYVLNLGGNDQPKVKELLDYLFNEITRYCIPRREFDEAIKKDVAIGAGSFSNLTALVQKAMSQFVSGTNSGEAGEILLYSLVEDVLEKPQLFCKMPHKTNSELNYNGIDGIHASVDKDANGKEVLSLYWGEAKLRADIGKAISDAVNTMKDFLLSEGGPKSVDERDLQLVRDNIDVLDENLQSALMAYFETDGSNYGNLNYKGVCLVGFDYEGYPNSPNSGLTTNDIKTKVEAEVKKWLKSIEKQISKHTHLNTFEIHIFLIPFVSVEDFKKAFAKRFGVK